VQGITNGASPEDKFPVTAAEVDTLEYFGIELTMTTNSKTHTHNYTT